MGGCFDTGCKLTQVREPQVIKKSPACASSESYSNNRAKPDATFFRAKLGNQEYHRMHNSGLLSRTRSRWTIFNIASDGASKILQFITLYKQLSFTSLMNISHMEARQDLKTHLTQGWSVQFKVHQFLCTILKAIQPQGIWPINPWGMEFCSWINFTATNKTSAAAMFQAWFTNYSPDNSQDQKNH